MRVMKLGSWFSALCALVAACSHPAADPAVPRGAPVAVPVPAVAPPVAPGWQLDRSTFDPSADPCTDFYQYACGGFAASAQIPPDRASVDAQRDATIAAGDRILQAMLTGAERSGEPAQDAEVGRLRTFFASCMAAGDRTTDPTLDAWLARIAAIRTRRDVLPVVHALHAIGVQALFRYAGEPDRADRTRYRGQIDQGDFGPQRIYREHGPELDARREAYRAHVEQMFVRAGIATRQAAGDARAVLALEATLVGAAQTFDEAFDPAASEHPMAPGGLAGLAPHVDWAAYLALVGHPADQRLNVSSPHYLKALDQVLATQPVEALRAYLRWRLLDALGPALPAPLADEVDRFTAGPGTQRPPRAEVCQRETVRAMGVELSRQFARRALDPEARDRATADAGRIQAEVAGAVRSIEWLSPAARDAASHKVATLIMKIGFPETWPATGSYPLRRDGFLDNVLAARQDEAQRTWQRARAERRRETWENVIHPNGAPGMAAARLTIPGGFPDVPSNSILFTAAFLRAPLYDPRAPLEVRYGQFGAVVAHELIHTLDNHEFDAQGEAHDDWPAADGAAHLARVGCVIAQADQAGLTGNAIFGESNADYGGIVHAYAALVRDAGPELIRRGGDGFTAAQRFFVAYAQHYCQAARPEVRAALRRDNHGPVEFRVNAPLSNLPAFAEAFACRAGAAMARPATARCTVW